MIRRIVFVLLATLLALTGLGLRPAQRAAAAPIYAPPGQYVMVLGDSLAWGYQAGRVRAAVAAGQFNPAAFNTGFGDDFTRMLAQIDRGITEINFACPGQTTADFINATTCPLPTHTPWTASTQLASAVAFLKAHPGQVNPIVLELGPNDIVQLVGPCGGLANLSCIAQKLPGAITSASQNFATILTALRAAAPTAEILVPGLYNPYAAADPSTNVLATAVNTAFAAATAPFGVVPVDWFTPFNATGSEPQTICALTLFCTPDTDIHASDLGYAVMARALWDASGFAQYTPGFFAIGATASPGAAVALFAPGKSCTGLVEIATRDLQPAGTAHIVYVTGNDMPGTVGDNGIVPGVTYSYEIVAAAAGGQQLDNNGGACYQVTR